MERREISEFKKFREKLYRGDVLYSGTAEFVADMLLYKTTDFAKSCDTAILHANDKSNVRAAQALWVHAPETDFASLAFFDCTYGLEKAACMLLRQAEELTKSKGLTRLIVGLNAHLSYGVGILTQTQLKNTFDTCYNKMYYSDFFASFPVCNTLTAYRCEIKDAREKLYKASVPSEGYSVRQADFKRFEQECEIMRGLCDRTIGNTYLYTPTRVGHFYELLKDMCPIMSGENLLFLMYGGKEVGFLFWHPDYNCIVKSGKPVSVISFAVACMTKKRKIDTVKLNSIGVEQAHFGRGTAALLKAMDVLLGEKYRYIETNFVWDNNDKSRLLNRRLIGGECRRFAVWEKEIGK